MSVRFLQFWQGDDGYAMLDNLDRLGVDRGIAAIVDNTPDSDIEDDTADTPGLPDLPGYRVYGEGKPYLIQVHWGMGHVALYAEV